MSNMYIFIEFCFDSDHNVIVETDYLFSSKEDIVEHSLQEIKNYTYNEAYSQYESSVMWNGHLCMISVDSDGEVSDVQLETLQELMSHKEQFDAACRKITADQLIDLANEWAEEGEITKEEFAERIVIENIVIDREGNIAMYYQDDDIFLGHIIVLYTDVKCENTEASIGG